MIKIPRPPGDSNIKIDPIFHNLNPGDTLIRIHNQKYDPIFFNQRPLGRFDHHDGLSNRGVFYAAPIINSHYDALAACLVEIFGNTRIIYDLTEFNVCQIKITYKLNLLDLRGSGAMKSGTVSAINGTTDRQISQEWGRFFYENENFYGRIDGIIYPSAYTGESLIVLYERASDSLIVVSDISLSDPIMSHNILEIANHFQLAIDSSVVSKLEKQNNGSSVTINHNEFVTSSNNLEDEKFDFLEQFISTAVSDAQQDMLKKGISYVYSRHDMLIEHNPDGSEEIIEYLPVRDPADRSRNTSTKI